MRRYRSLILGTLALLVIAALSALGAAGMMTSLIDYRSPLHANPPAPGPALGSPMTRKVVIVLVDALRLDTSLKTSLMPYLNELRKQGASAIMHSQPPSFSMPGYATILTGAWPDINDGPPVNFNFRSVVTFTQDDLFSAAHRSGLKTAISGYYWFQKLVPQTAVDASFYTQGEDAAADEDVMQAVPTILVGDYSFVLIHLDQVDYAGHHQGGPLGPGWKAAARRADDLLREIVAPLDLSQDTLLVTSDHGQIDAGGHGGPEPINLLEPFVMVGVGVTPGQYPDIQQVDVAPTVAVLLGTNIPASSQGYPQMSMLALSRNFDVGSIRTACGYQYLALMQAYAASIGEKLRPFGIDVPPFDPMEGARSNKLNHERLWRSAVAILLGLIPAAILIIRKEKRILWPAIGALLYTLLFNFKYAIFDGHPYSLSWIENPSAFLIELGVTSTIALIVTWLVIMARQEAFSKSPRRAARTSMWAILGIVYILLLPVLVNFAINGLLTEWTLPEFYTIFIALLSFIQILFVVILGLLLTGLIAFITRLIPHSKYSAA